MAGSPGTLVEPMWSTPRAPGTASRSTATYPAASAAQSSRYGDTSTRSENDSSGNGTRPP